MTSKKSAPPRFRNDVPYKVWKNKLSMWTLVTAVPKREQAIIVLLESLDGNHKAEKAVADLTWLHTSVSLPPIIKAEKAVAGM